MPILDFKEIPEAHLSSGHQDRFELFARDCVEFLGYKVIETPGRGADGGSDLIAQEVRKGVAGETVVRWLVSCKHKAHSGKAVGVDDEANILERVRAKQAQGFIGFYSTLATSSLCERLRQLKIDLESQVFDHELIEKRLLDSRDGLGLAKRYFPESIQKWVSEHPKPARLWEKPEMLLCEYCDKDLIQQYTYEGPGRSLVSFWTAHPDDRFSGKVDDIYWSCKGHCDGVLEHANTQQGLHYSGWRDLSHFCIPTAYIFFVMAMLNAVGKDMYSTTAVDKMKSVLLATFPLVSRDLTDDEREKLEFLMQVPATLGGVL